MNLEVISILAKAALAQPYGFAIPELVNNPESFNPYLRFLHNAVDYYEPQIVIECGVYMGTASEYMAIAGRKTTLVVGIDIQPHHHATNVIYPRNKNLVLIQGDTCNIETVEKVRELIGNGKVGLLFLDSAHDGVTPLLEFKLYQEFFAEECLVVCDDIIGDQLSEDDRKAMQEFWKNFPGEKLELHELHPAYSNVATPGFGVSIIKR